MELDWTLRQEGRGHEPIHEAAMYAMEAHLKAQYANGAWPQGYREPADPKAHKIVRGNYPEELPVPRTKRDYWFDYTLNDGAMLDVVEMMIRGYEIYGDNRFWNAAIRGADFLLIAQMPEPQPAWAQQYNFDMEPSWARKFEPVSVSGGESQTAIALLMKVYEWTGDERYLEPIPRALAYLKASELDDGRLARFYELKTNKPLYFDREYNLTYDDSDMPTHYGFKITSKLDSLQARFDRVKDKGDREPLQPRPDNWRMKPIKVSANEAHRLINQLDARGAWVESGRLRYFPETDPTREVISSKTFVGNLVKLAGYVGHQK